MIRYLLIACGGISLLLGIIGIFFAAVADHAVRTTLRRLLGKGIPALSPLAAPAPLFRPDGS